MSETMGNSRFERLDAAAGAVPSSEGTAAIEGGRRGSKDAQIRLAIMEALYWDLAVPPHAVTVEVENGWATLRGQVSRPFARHRAEWAARGAPGVAGVANAITLAG